MKQSGIYAIIFGSVIVVNLIIFVLVKGFPTQTTEERTNQELYLAGEYADYIASSEYDALNASEQTEFVLATIKLGDFDQAHALLLKQATGNPTMKTILKGLGLIKKQDFATAEDILSQLGSSDPELMSTITLLRGYTRYQRKRYREAIALFEDSLRQDPFAPASLHYLTLAYVNTWQKAEAQEMLSKLETRGSSDIDISAYKGIVMYQYRNYEEALEYFQAAQQHDELSSFYLAQTYKELGGYQTALQILERLLAEYPDEYAYMFEKANVIYRMGDSDGSLTMLEELSSYKENQSKISLWLNMIPPVVDLGKTTKLRVVVAQTEELLGSNPRYYADFISALNRAGEYELARKYSEESQSLALREQDETLQNEIARAIIHNMVIQISPLSGVIGTGQMSRHQELVAHPGSTLTDREVFIALGYMLQGDMVAAERGLQEVLITVTTEDLQVIRILHHILANQPQRALAVLTQLTPDEFIDLDYIWLKRKVTSMLGPEADEYRQVAENEIALLEVVPGLEKEKIEEEFIHHFDKRLKYMLPYYPDYELPENVDS